MAEKRVNKKLEADALTLSRRSSLENFLQEGGGGEEDRREEGRLLSGAWLMNGFDFLGESERDESLMPLDRHACTDTRAHPQTHAHTHSEHLVVHALHPPLCLDGLHLANVHPPLLQCSLLYCPFVPSPFSPCWGAFINNTGGGTGGKGFGLLFFNCEEAPPPHKKLFYCLPCCSIINGKE